MGVMLITTVVTGVANTVVASNDNLGLTWAALILFLGGTVGAWLRAAISSTQDTGGWAPWRWDRRTWRDVILGGAAGIVLPVVVKQLPVKIDFTEWTVLQQAVVAMLLGHTGSWVYTAIGWKKGWIVPSDEEREPRVGVLKPKSEAPKPNSPLEGGPDAP